MKKVPQKDPAIKNYFLGKGYKDFIAAIVDRWKRNERRAKDLFLDAPGIYGGEEAFKTVFFITAGICSFIFGTLISFLMSILHIFILISITPLVLILFTITWLIERIYLGFRVFFMACPHCHKKSLIPEYYCDNCGEVHKHLLPNKYGAFFHTCKCGQKLPSSFFSNRGKLQARCPSCNVNIDRGYVESKKIFIPIMGGPSVGKSAFLFSSTFQLIKNKPKTFNFKTEPFDTISKRAYRNVIELFPKGSAPKKTQDLIPRAFNLAIRKKGRLSYLLYLYDPAGEAYQEASKLTAHRFYEYLSGFILVVDPFSIPSVQLRYRNELKKYYRLLKPSEISVEDTVDRILMTLEVDFGLSKKGRVKQPIAVVLSKIDAFDLEEILGETAIDRVIASQSEDTQLNRDEIQNIIVRKQLIDWGENALVNQLEGRFTKVKYFACSSLGRMLDGEKKSFSSISVLAPLSWLFSTIDKYFFITDEVRNKRHLRATKRKKKVLRVFKYIAILFSVVLISYLLWINVLNNIYLYSEAKKLEISGNHLEAFQEYATLGKYRDSFHKVVVNYAKWIDHSSDNITVDRIIGHHEWFLKIGIPREEVFFSFIALSSRMDIRDKISSWQWLKSNNSEQHFELLALIFKDIKNNILKLHNNKEYIEFINSLNRYDFPKDYFYQLGRELESEGYYSIAHAVYEFLGSFSNSKQLADDLEIDVSLKSVETFETIKVKVIRNSPYDDFPIFTRDGWEFSGWWTQPWELGVRIFPETIVDSSTNILYAHWLPAECEVTFNLQGGFLENVTSDSLKMKVVNRAKYGELPIPKKYGYTFDGWWTLVDGISSKVESDTQANIVSGQKIYAKWKNIIPELGGVGPAGGYIFYDKGNSEDNWRYLEVAPISTEKEYIVWGGRDLILAYGDSRTIGSGETNTQKILDYMKSFEHFTFDTFAAEYCDNLVYGGAEDWFLPSKNELKLLFTNFLLSKDSDKSVGQYWSSTDFDKDNALILEISEGKIYYASKTSKRSARAIRAFK